MSEIIDRLDLQQNRITLELTGWLIDHKFFPVYTDSQQLQEALLQCWVRLLVQSTLESFRLGDPELLADFFVVLREEGGLLYVPESWLAALSWLFYRCQKLSMTAPAPRQSPVCSHQKNIDRVAQDIHNPVIANVKFELEMSQTIPVPVPSQIFLN